MYKNHTANIIPSGERWNVFFLRAAREKCLLSQLLVNTALEVQVSVIRPENKIKGIQIIGEYTRLIKFLSKFQPDFFQIYIGLL